VIVADTNLLIYFWVPGEFSEAAQKVFEKDPHWASPVLWKSEFRNILATYMRKKVLPLEKALAVMEKAGIQMEHAQFQVSSSAVLELAAASSCSAYDCEFAALARHLDTKLVTLDKKLMKAFQETAVSIEGFLDLE